MTNGLFQICFFFSKATIIRSLSHLQLLAYYSKQAQDLKCVLRSESERVSASFNNLQALSPIDLNLTFTGIHKPNVIGVTLGVRILVVFLFVLFVFSVRLLSVLRGHSVFSSPPQRPMTPDFEGFLYQILSITLFS